MRIVGFSRATPYLREITCDVYIRLSVFLPIGPERQRCTFKQILFNIFDIPLLIITDFIAFRWQKNNFLAQTPFWEKIGPERLQDQSYRYKRKRTY